MNEVIFELIKVIVMAIVAGTCVYLIPLIKERVGAERLAQMEEWAANAVLYAEQWMKTDGKEKKEMVTTFLKKVRDDNHLSITDEQINILIEAAVKQMNMAVDESNKEEE